VAAAVVMLVEHKEIRCTVGVSQGMNQSVVVTARGVEGPPLSRQRFRYQKSGCNAREAENYDPAVTDNDGSCRILGCTKQESSNYNPFATVDDGSCVRGAEIVSMKVRRNPTLVHLHCLASHGVVFNWNGITWLHWGWFEGRGVSTSRDHV
jgi:hypothetical protein